MTTPSDSALLSHYVNWALGVRDPMTLEYQKNADFVTLTIPTDFVASDVCKECDEDGPHISPDHIFRIILEVTKDDTNEMKIFNDHNNNCLIPSNTEAFQSLEPLISDCGNECYFYGTIDEDDRSKLYIDIKKLPTQ